LQKYCSGSVGDLEHGYRSERDLRWHRGGEGNRSHVNYMHPRDTACTKLTNDSHSRLNQTLGDAAAMSLSQLLRVLPLEPVPDEAYGFVVAGLGVAAAARWWSSTGAGVVGESHHTNTLEHSDLHVGPCRCELQFVRARCWPDYHHVDAPVEYSGVFSLASGLSWAWTWPHPRRCSSSFLVQQCVVRLECVECLRYNVRSAPTNTHAVVNMLAAACDFLPR